MNLSHGAIQLKAFIFLVVVAQIFVSSEVTREITDHGITLLKGTQDELDKIKNDLESLRDTLAYSERKRRSPNPAQDGLKDFIMFQIAKAIDEEYAVKFDEDSGIYPARGEYRMAEVDLKLITTGLKKQAEEDYGALPLPRSHYCRYRNPTENVVNGILDDKNCCEGENKQCYTEAGCFCDESCYTKYGDCCTDHFVQCYQQLKLCLIKVDDDKAALEQKEAASKYNGNKQHISNNLKTRYEGAQVEFQDVMQQRASNAFHNQPRPTDLAPNECCAQKPYNSHNENADGHYPKCCSGNLIYVDEGLPCPQD